MEFGPALVLRGARERLSPILMTSLATGLALVPLVALGDGRGTRSSTRSPWSSSAAWSPPRCSTSSSSRRCTCGSVTSRAAPRLRRETEWHMIRSHQRHDPASRPAAAGRPPRCALLACGLLAGCGAARPGAAAGRRQPPAGPAEHRPAQAGGSAPARGRPVLHAARRQQPDVPAGRGHPVHLPRARSSRAGTTPHSVMFTVTDLTKQIDGVRTVVALDQDFLQGELQEQELAFFAQDDAGNVWNFGEYPEEYENGKLTGAPSTWIRGTGGAYGGIHMLGQPAVGAAVPGRAGAGDRVLRRLPGHQRQPARRACPPAATAGAHGRRDEPQRSRPAATRSSTTRRASAWCGWVREAGTRRSSSRWPRSGTWTGRRWPSGGPRRWPWTGAHTTCSKVYRVTPPAPAGQPRDARRSAHQVPPERIGDQLGPVPRPGLGQQVVDVRLHRRRETESSAAISALDRPAAISVSTSTSRWVSPSTGLDGPRTCRARDAVRPVVGRARVGQPKRRPGRWPPPACAARTGRAGRPPRDTATAPGRSPRPWRPW